MGGCQSSLVRDVLQSSNSDSTPSVTLKQLSTDDSLEILEIVSKIPVHCREAILALPAKQFLMAYQHHLVGKYYYDQEKYCLGLKHQVLAINGLLTMMPNKKDHFIFARIYNVMSTCSLQLGTTSAAIETSKWALGIISKHTPTNYVAISFQYTLLALALQAAEEWRESTACWTKAIENARLMPQPDEEYIHKLEADRNLTRDRILDNMQITVYKLEPNPGENNDDFHRRVMAGTIDYNARNGTLGIDVTEFERLPQKQTELQVTDDILADVLQNFQAYLHDIPKESGGIDFLAAHFKRSQMKTSSLSPMIIEAALTIIIDRLNNVNFVETEQYTALKESSFLFSYTHEDHWYKKGIRAFQVKSKTKQSDDHQ